MALFAVGGLTAADAGRNLVESLNVALVHVDEVVAADDELARRRWSRPVRSRCGFTRLCRFRGSLYHRLINPAQFFQIIQINKRFWAFATSACADAL